MMRAGFLERQVASAAKQPREISRPADHYATHCRAVQSRGRSRYRGTVSQGVTVCDASVTVTYPPVAGTCVPRLPQFSVLVNHEICTLYTEPLAQVWSNKRVNSHTVWCTKCGKLFIDPLRLHSLVHQTRCDTPRLASLINIFSSAMFISFSRKRAVSRYLFGSQGTK